jgi:hypothetical protein
MANIVAVAIVRSDPPQVFIAEDQETLNWVLALKLIAATPGDRFNEGLRDVFRDALLEERWGDAVLRWIEHNDVAVDVYSSETLYEPTDVDMAADELQFTPLFRD